MKFRRQTVPLQSAMHLRLPRGCCLAAAIARSFLITDGVNNSGDDPMEVAQRLGTQHIPVYPVGIGTQNGGLIPGTNEEATIDEDALPRLRAG